MDNPLTPNLRFALDGIFEKLDKIADQTSPPENVSPRTQIAGDLKAMISNTQSVLRHLTDIIKVILAMSDNIKLLDDTIRALDDRMDTHFNNTTVEHRTLSDKISKIGSNQKSLESSVEDLMLFNKKLRDKLGC